MYKFIKDIYRKYFKNYATQSYSQEGEDLLLRRYFGEEKTQGFYIDIGAHHPSRYSNTFMFYKMGWTGVNIEPNPEIIDAFKLLRPKDHNLNIGIGKDKDVLTYYFMSDPALNTFDKTLADIRNDGTYQIIKNQNISVLPLVEVLDSIKLPSIIDFMSVDVEGLDLMVLQSNSWEKYRPKIILIEILDTDLENIKSNDIYNYLLSIQYTLSSKLVHTCLFIDTLKR